MAQQLGQIRFIGKVGNLVGFTNSASLKKDAVFVRTAPDDVYNPQSNGQARQRSRLKPALNFYSAFAPVLSCAFYPGRKENKNKRYFMRRAMKETVISDVYMGEQLIPFLPYQISRGQLGLDALCQYVGEFASPVDNGRYICLNLPMVDPIAKGDTIAEVTENFMEKNPSLKDGMQLTFLFVLYNWNDYDARPAYCVTFVLDSKNTLTKWQDIAHTDLFWFDIGAPDDYEDPDAGLLSLKPRDDEWQIGSLGLIISGRKGSGYDYTNSFMQLTEDGNAIRATRARKTHASYQPSHHPV